MEALAAVSGEGHFFGFVWKGLRRIEFGNGSTHFEVRFVDVIVGSSVRARVIIPVEIPSDRSVKLPFIVYNGDSRSTSDSLSVTAEKISTMLLNIYIIQKNQSGIFSKTCKVIELQSPKELKPQEKCIICVTSDRNLMKAVIEKEDPVHSLGGGGEKTSEDSLNLKRLSTKQLLDKLGIVTDKVIKYESIRQKGIFEWDEKSIKKAGDSELNYCESGVMLAEELLTRKIDLTEEQKAQALKAISDFNRLKAEIIK